MSVPGYPLAPDAAVEWSGAKRHYDLIKEAFLAIVAVGVLTLLLAFLFSSPDDRPVTVAKWATVAPADFLTTAVSELDGTSGVATYGPPYSHVAGSGQNIIGGLSLQRLIGVRIPINSAKAFVLDPLSIPAQSNAALALALHTYEHAAQSEQQSWALAFAKIAAKPDVAALVRQNPTRYGPVPAMMAALLSMGQSGALDGALVSTGHFYQTNFTKSLLFLADGSYLESLAAKDNLLGSEWGMMNETGSYPGQAWLWLYTFWYQIPPFSTSDNADAQVWALMALLSIGFIGVPFIPGVRSIPRYVPIYRLIWRDYYAVARGERPPD